MRQFRTGSEFRVPIPDVYWNPIYCFCFSSWSRKTFAKIRKP